MIHSAKFCHAQAAIQGERAANSGLHNVREIAAKAVIAWNQEGELAEARERRRRIADAAKELFATPPAPDDLPADCREPDDDEGLDDCLMAGLSENPDRELAAA